MKKFALRFFMLTAFIMVLTPGVGLANTQTPLPCTQIVRNYLTFGFNGERTSYNPYECQLDDRSNVSIGWNKNHPANSIAHRDGISVYQNQGFVGIGDSMNSLDLNTGNIQWTVKTGDTIIGAATVHSEILYFGSQDKYLYAVDVNTGKIIWQSPASSSISSTPIVAHGLTFSTADDGVVEAFDASTGVLVWSYRTGAEVISSPSTSNGVVYISAGSTNPALSNVLAFNALTGTLLWKSPNITAQLTDLAINHGYVYAGANNTSTSVYAIDASTGSISWSKNTANEAVVSKLAVDDKQVYVVTTRGRLLAFDAVTGTQHWTRLPPFGALYESSSPTVANGMVYITGREPSNWGALEAYTTGGTWIYGRSTSYGPLTSPATVVNGKIYVTGAPFNGQTDYIVAYW